MTLRTTAGCGLARMAEADGNRTRLTGILGHTDFEDQEGHQAPRRLREEGRGMTRPPSQWRVPNWEDPLNAPHGIRPRRWVRLQDPTRRARGDDRRACRGVVGLAPGRARSRR